MYCNDSLSKKILVFLTQRFAFGILALTFLLIAPSFSLANSTRSSLSDPREKAIPTKGQVIEQLRNMRKKHLAALESLDSLIQKGIQDSSQIQLQGANSEVLSRKLEFFTESLDKLFQQRDELKLRREFADRLIFQIDTKWSNQPLRQFLEHLFLELAENEIENPSTAKIWKFYTYLSIAIREIPDSREDIVAFIDGYLSYSSISVPRQPHHYIQERSYTNGEISTGAQVVNPQIPGDFLEQKLKANKTLSTSRTRPKATGALKTPPVIELRLTQPKVANESDDSTANPDTK